MTELTFVASLNPDQEKKFNEWKNAHKLIFGEYGHYTYSFYPTSVDTYFEVKSELSNQSITFLL
jgi:hypothetical protein